MISHTTFAAMYTSLAVSVLLPVVTLIYFRRKYHISIKAVTIGVVIFIVFAQVLEQIMHYFVLRNTSIMSHPFWFALYGGLAAGVFEEIGRYVGFKNFLKENREWKDGIAYGIGHGGIEAWLVGGVAMIQLIVFATLMNHGTFDQLASRYPAQALESIKSALTGPAWVLLVAGIERIFAFILHLALSLTVLYGIRLNKMKYLVYAILVHAVIDFPAAFYQAHKLSLWQVETYVGVIALVLLWYIVFMKKKFAEAGPAYRLTE